MTFLLVYIAFLLNFNSLKFQDASKNDPDALLLLSLIRPFNNQASTEQEKQEQEKQEKQEQEKQEKDSEANVRLHLLGSTVCFFRRF